MNRYYINCDLGYVCLVFCSKLYYHYLKFYFNGVSFSGGKTPEVNSRGYTQIMKEQMLKGEEKEVIKYIKIYWLIKTNVFFL